MSAADVDELDVDFDDVVDPVWVKDLEAYLRRFPPARAGGQFREGRRDPGLRSLIVVHTAESGTDLSGPDPKAEAVAGFVQRRSDAGSYHLVGDADSVIQLVRFSDEAFHVRGGWNRTTIGISLAINAEDWPNMTPARRGQFVHVAASMAAYAGAHMYLRGMQVPAARYLTKAEAESGRETGITSHERLDPTRRSDPGPQFPWRAFLRRYQDLVEPLTGYLLQWGADDFPVNTWELYVEEAQRLLGVEPDGKFGPVTLAKLQSLAGANDDMQNALASVAESVKPWTVWGV